MKKGIAILSLGTMLMSVSAMEVAGTISMNKAVASSSTSGTGSESGLKSIKYACGAAAIDKRETAIISAFDINAVAIKSSLIARKEGLIKLYTEGKTEGKKDARKAVWSAFSSSTHTAMNDMRTARKSAWNTFQKDMQACGIKSNNEKMETISVPIAY